METRSISDKARIIVTKDMMDVSITTLLLQLYNASHLSYTHSLNVAYLTAQITLSKGYEKDIAKDIIIGALLHDIGKTFMPEILSKKQSLTENEFTEIKKHPEYGIQLIKETAPHLDRPIITDIVLHHHEKTDGSGYPHGITDIPEYVKIVHAVDMYDAITSDKKYRKGKPGKQGIQTLIYEKIDQEIVMLLRGCAIK